MMYNAMSLRQILLRAFHRASGADAETAKRKIDSRYDANEEGEGAPCIEYTKPRELKNLFRRFSKYRYDIRNFDGLPYVWNVDAVRKLFLYTVARVGGLDLYITVKK